MPEQIAVIAEQEKVCKLAALLLFVLYIYL